MLNGSPLAWAITIAMAMVIILYSFIYQFVDRLIKNKYWKHTIVLLAFFTVLFVFWLWFIEQVSQLMNG